MGDREKLRNIIQRRSFREKGAFKPASGRMSTIYFNLKPTMLDPEGARFIDLALAAKAGGGAAAQSR
jgi:orotate phosphoribosyltransferase